MSTSESNKHHFLIYAPDHTDPGTFQRRQTHRPEHLERVGTLRSSGVFSV